MCPRCTPQEATISDDDDDLSEKENGDSPVHAAAGEPKDSQLAHDSQMIDLEMLSQPDTFMLAAAAGAAGHRTVGASELPKAAADGAAGGDDAAGLPTRLRSTLPPEDLDSLVTYFRAASCHAEQDLQARAPRSRVLLASPRRCAR